MPPQSSYGSAKTKPKKPRAGGFPATRSAERTYMQRFGKRGTPRRGTPRRGGRRPGADPVLAPQAPPTAAATIPTVDTALSGGMGGYDLGADPAVALAAGLAAKQRAMAQASALAKRKQAAIEYGDPSGVTGLDDATQKAARDNPFSVLKRIDRSYETGTRELEEGLNAANLFYSGYRGQQLAEAARGYQQTKYDAANSFRGLLTDIDAGLADALMQADYLDAQAMMGSDGGYYGGYDEGSDSGSDGITYSLAGDAKQALGIPRRTQKKPPPLSGGKGRKVGRVTSARRKIIRRTPSSYANRVM